MIDDDVPGQGLRSLVVNAKLGRVLAGASLGVVYELLEPPPVGVDAREDRKPVAGRILRVGVGDTEQEEVMALLETRSAAVSAIDIRDRAAPRGLSPRDELHISGTCFGDSQDLTFAEVAVANGLPDHFFRRESISSHDRLLMFLDFGTRQLCEAGDALHGDLEDNHTEVDVLEERDVVPVIEDMRSS